MRILILGGTGAMGVSLVEILANTTHEIYVTSRCERSSKSKNLHFLEGNAQESSFIENVLREEYDVIVDFMIYSEQVFKQRVDRFLNSTKQYIYLSSSRVYAECNGKIKEESPRLLDVCEDVEYLATEEYALLKARQENMLMNSNKINWTIVRPYITYNTERLQLGVFEKEYWLQRALNGKTIVFPKDMASKTTTMTYGYDVAYAISKLIGNQKAYGEIYHITTNESKTWGEILNIYLNIIEDITNKRPKVHYIENSEPLLSVWGKYQIYYDRLYVRTFDNSKISKICNHEIKFTSIEDGLRKSLETFIKDNRTFKGFPVKTEVYFNKLTNEKIGKNEIASIKDKIKYLIVKCFFIMK